MAALLVLGAAGGCNRGEDESLGRQQPKDTTLERAVTLRVTGERTVSIDTRMKVRFLSRPGKGENAGMSVASVTFPEPHRMPDGLFVSPEIAIVGMYSGDGRFTLPAGLGPRPTTGPTAPELPSDSTVKVSVAQILTYRAEPPEETRFNYLLEPCKVTLDDEVTKGSAECPALVAHDGKRVSLSMSWKP